MSETRSLLLEIGTEELPSAVVDLWTGRTGGSVDQPAWPARVAAALRDDLRLDFTGVKLTGTPRRLLLSVDGLPAEQPSRTREVKGPPTRAAFTPEGAPTKAGEGFARSQGVEVAALERRDVDGGEYVYAVVQDVGRPTAELLAEWLPELIGGFPLPKSMRWGSGELRFSRPIRWLLCLLGDQVVDFKLGDLSAGGTTLGHRFLAPGPHQVGSPGQYAQVMEDAKVAYDQDARRQRCIDAVKAAADRTGLNPVIAEKVIGEVTNLVEWPSAAVGSFDEEVLAIPRQVIVSSMQKHQRYFPLENRGAGSGGGSIGSPSGSSASDNGHPTSKDISGTLSNHFVVIHNGREDAEEMIVRGHERVIRARLSDAHFFYTEDQKVPLESLLPRLGGVTYHNKLGTLLDKTGRLESLTQVISSQLGLAADESFRAAEAAAIAKADLLTNMVTEFPDLQGVMGREYARIEGRPAEVCEALYEHYLPRSRSDSEFPSTTEGTVLSLADKLDGVVSFLSVGIAPSGSQDPYALRRQASGVVRLIAEKGITPDLSALVTKNIELLEAQGVRVPADEDGKAKTRHGIAALLFDQLRRDLLNRGTRYDVLDAVFVPLLEQKDPLAVDLKRLAERAETLNTALGSKELDDACVIYTRCKNLSKDVLPTVPQPAQLTDPAEQALAEAFIRFDSAFEGATSDGDSSRMLGLISGLRPAVDRFFDEVLVMADDEALRLNRQGLLASLAERAAKLADFSKIVQD